MSDEDRIASILGEWQARRDRGEEVAPETVIGEHPDLADRLRAKLAALVGVERVLADAQRPLRSLTPDRYVDFKPVGAGGMGIVYWAIDTDLNREVAFKVIRPGSEVPEAPARPTDLATPGADTPASKAFETLKQRFLQEAWITSGMAHPGIVPVYELGQTDEGVPYYTMRFVKGERTLADAITEVRERGIEERLALLEPFLKVCDTLAYAHSRGVLHRDLKPANVALGEFGEVVVLDWGLAKLKGAAEAGSDRLAAHIQAYRDATDMRTMTSAMGTPGYMPPEAIRGDVGRMDARSDVYSLGAVLYQILTGRLPFAAQTFGELAGQVLREEATPAHDLDATVPGGLSALCARCLARDMDTRPTSAEVVAVTLRSWQLEQERNREIDGLLREARTALDAAEGLQGAELMQQADRAAAAVNQVLQRRPEDERGVEYARLLDALREKGAAERERYARRRTLIRAGLTALVVLVVGAVVAVWLVDAARRDEAAAKVEAVTARNQARAEGLVTAAEDAAARDPTLSLLLAREAVHLEASPRALSVLHEAVMRCQRFRDYEGSLAGGAAGTKADGNRFLTRSKDEPRSYLWSPAQEEPVAVLPTRGDICAYSSDSRYLVIAGPGATLWDMEGRFVARLGAEDMQVSHVQFSPACDCILTCSGAASGSILRIWGLDGTRQAEHEIPATEQPIEEDVQALVSTADGVWVVTVSALDETVRLWRGARDAPVEVLPERDRGADSAGFSPSGRFLGVVYSGVEGNQVVVYDGDRKPVAVAAGDDLPVFSPDEGRFATIETVSVGDDDEGMVHLASTSGESPITLRVPGELPEQVRFLPGGEGILTTSKLAAREDVVLRLWDAAGRLLAMRHDATGTLWVSDVSTDGTRILVDGPNGWLVLDRSLVSLAGPLDLAGSSSATFVPGTHAILAGHGEQVRLLWAEPGEVAAILPLEGPPLAVSPTGALQVVRRPMDGTLRLLDSSHAEIARLRGPAAEVHSVCFSHDGSRVLASSSDGAVYLWDLQGQLQATLRRSEPDFSLVDAGFSPDDRYVISNHRILRQGNSAPRSGGPAPPAPPPEYVLTIWSPAGSPVGQSRAYDRPLNSMTAFVELWGGQPAAYCPDTLAAEGPVLFRAPGDLRTCDSYVWTVGALSPDGEHVALLDAYDRVGLAALEEKRVGSTTSTMTYRAIRAPALRLVGHRGAIHEVNYAPSGDRIVTASADGTVRIWDLKTGDSVILRGHGRPVRHAWFSPDGAHVLSVSEEGRLLIWAANRDELLRIAGERLSRGFSDDERARYSRLLPKVREE